MAIKILVVMGTRPEAIKMAPVIKNLRLRSDVFETHVCVTAQHRSMLDQVLDFFEIAVDTDLDIMQHQQTLAALSSRILEGVTAVIESFEPDYVLVHGDTSTAMMSSIASFYQQKKIVHIEAGLRTYDIYSPFPEEANRQIISKLATLHAAPTETCFNVLVTEGLDKERIAITGNTVIDALFLGLKIIAERPSKRLIDFKKTIGDKRVILVTAHRRENLGKGIGQICDALKQIALQNPEILIVFPVHLNPKVKKPVHSLLGELENILLIEPLEYERFIWLMQRSIFIITDSGGIQEEAPSLNKPVIVMRKFTERQEAVDCGAVVLVGSDTFQIVKVATELLRNKTYHSQMAAAINPYGDGTAAIQILNFIEQHHGI